MLVIIPATSRHKPVVELSISRLVHYFPQANFLIVCPSPGVFAHLMSNNIEITADNEFAPVTKKILAAELSPAKRHLVNWYYQQFLKYAVVMKIREDRVLVIDADTVLLRNIECGPNVFFTSKERHKGYFEHFRCLFGVTAPFQASAITNFMWFYPEALREMISEILKRNNDRKWWEIIICIANDISSDGAFSEYETYANWFSLRYGHHAEVPFHIFRRGDLLVQTEADYSRAVDEVEAKGYDAIAFEFNHSSGFFRRLGARMMLKFAIKLW